MLKSLFHRDTSLNEIRESLLKTRRLQGTFRGHHWQIVVGKPVGDGVFQIVSEGSWRINLEKTDLFCCWKTDELLNDYLHKKTINSDTVRFNIAEYERRNPKTKLENPGLYSEQTKSIELQVPFSPLELAHSAIFCLDLDIPQIQHHIMLEHDQYLFLSGNLPLKPVVVGVWANQWRSELQPVLRIVFKPYHAKPEK